MANKYCILYCNNPQIKIGQYVSAKAKDEKML